MGEYLSSTKSDSMYTPYAVHVFPGGVSASNTLTAVQANGGSSCQPFSSRGAENPVEYKVSSTTGHSDSSPLSEGMSHWDVHPSLKALLGDLCSDHDVDGAVNHSRIDGFPNKEFHEEDTDRPLSAALSHRLSIGAPEFVPSFLNPKQSLSPSSGLNLSLDLDPYIAPAPSEIAQAAFTQSHSSTATDKSDQCLRNKLNVMSDSSPLSRSRPQFYPTGKNIIEKKEDRNLISFDGDFPLISEASHHLTDQHSFSSKHEQSYDPASSFEESFLPEQNEHAKENRFEQNAHFEAPSVPQVTLTNHHSANEALHNAPEGAMSSIVQSYEYEEEIHQVPAETRQSRFEIPSQRPVFKTYAEATNFYYSLLEQESREKLFQDSKALEPIQPPGLTPPGHSGTDHTFDRPNWAAAPDENIDPSIQYNQHSQRSERFNGSRVPTRSKASYEGESLVDIQGNTVTRVPRSLDGRDYVETGGNHFAETNDTGTYSPYALSDDKGDRNGRPYPDKKRFFSRGSNHANDSEDLEREIDEYHENLRAKANRSSQQQSSRAKNAGNGFSNGGNYNDLEKEIDGFHDNLRAKANRGSAAAAGRGSGRNGGGGGGGNGTPPSSDNDRRGRDLSRRSIRGIGEDWVNNANWSQTAENANANGNGAEYDDNGGGWGCE